MERFEINVWKDAELLSKEVVQFPSRKECYDYVTEKYHGPNSWTGAHQNSKTGMIRWRAPVGIRVTWGKLPEYKYKPKKLSAEDKKLQKELYDSITEETVNNEGRMDMFAKLRKYYGPNPDAKGYDEFPSRKRDKTYDQK